MFTDKKVKIEITLFETTRTGEGTVTDFSSGKTITFENCRASCKIKKVPSTAGYSASIDIFGASKQHLDQMTTIFWLNGFITPRRIKIFANDGEGYVLLFEGGIMEAIPNYTSVPDVSIHIESSMLVYPNLMSVPPMALESGTNISLFCKTLCGAYNVNCSIYGFDTKVWDGGTRILSQDGLGNRLNELCKICNLEYSFIPNGVRIYPKGYETRKIHYFTPSNYIGYPTFETFGVSISTSELKEINCGDFIEISGSEVGPANGTWVVNMINYNLEARKPKGAWFMTIHGTRFGK